MPVRQGRAFTRGMRAAAEQLAAGDASAAAAVVANARGYAALLRLRGESPNVNFNHHRGRAPCGAHRERRAPLAPFGIAVLAFRDPDNIQVELTAPLA